MALGRDERHESLQEKRPDMFMLDENNKMGPEAMEYEVWAGATWLRH
jgi:hypothetical protein